MEPVSGLEFIENLKNRVPDEEMPPILVLTADNSPETRREARWLLGASDFLTKPLDASEVLLRFAEFAPHARDAAPAVRGPRGT